MNTEEKAQRIILFCSQNHINISPRDRLSWTMFGNALKLLGYDEDMFVALSDPDASAEARMTWRKENTPQRYMTAEQAAAKIIALAREAGVDMTEFGKVDALTPTQPTQPKPPSIYCTPLEVEAAAAEVDKTPLYSFLCSHFVPDDVRRVMSDYKVGGHHVFERYRPGLATTFPFINAQGRIVDVHIMAYNADGHRTKCDEMYKCQTWLLAIKQLKDRRAPWPLFGEHLVGTRPTAPIAIVESEKTAIIGAIASPKYVWCATQSMTNLTPHRLAAVKRRAVFVFPDLDGVDKWEAKVAALSSAGYQDIHFCSQFIRDNAVDDHDDIGDIIIRNTPKP